MTPSSPKSLIDASMFVHVCHDFIWHLIVWACWSAFIYPFEDIQLLLFGFCFLFCQLDGQECLGPLSSYLCFLTSYSFLAASQNLNKYFSILCVRSTWSSVSTKDWPLKPPKCISVEPTQNLGLTECLGLIWFSISVTPIPYSRLHRVSLSTDSWETRWHR